MLFNKQNQEVHDTDNVFIDADAYSGSQEINFRDLVLRHYERVLILTKGEFCPGYWTKTNLVVGGSISNEPNETYHEDTRKAFINCVNGLHDSLIAYFDSKMKEASQNHEKEVEKFQESFEKGNEPTELEENEQKDPVWKMLRLKRKLFQELSCFLYRIKYLKGKVAEASIH